MPPTPPPNTSFIKSLGSKSTLLFAVVFIATMFLAVTFALKGNFSGSTPVGQVIQQDLFSYASSYGAGQWKFDEEGQTVLDSSGAGKHGTIVGSTSRGAGKYGSSISFLSAGSYAETPVTTQSDEGTVSLWVNPRVALSQGKNYPIFVAGGPNSGTSLSLFFGSWSSVGGNSGNNWSAEMMGGYKQNIRVNSPVTAVPSGWTHLAFVWNVQTGISLYINGELKAFVSGVTGSPKPIMQLIGGSKTANFAGDIDEVFVFKKALTASDVYTLYTGSGSGGGGTPPPPPPPPPPTTKPDLTFSASPSTVEKGKEVTLAWQSAGVDTCEASNGWSGAKGLQGSEAVTPSVDTTYTLRCNGKEGSVEKGAQVRIASSTVVTNPPSVTLSASPTSVERGAASTLTWSSTGADSCVASGGWSGSKALSGSQTLTPQLSASYTLTCANKGGSTLKAVTITVTGGSINYEPTGRYRYNQKYLYTSIDATTIPNRVSGGYPFNLDGRTGPHYEYVDFGSGWAWRNKGGDWIDASRTLMGSNSWAKVLTNKGSTKDDSAAYQADVTTALKFVQENNRWNAWIVRNQGALRKIAGMFNTDTAKHPRIEVTYTDGTTATLKPRVTAFIGSGQSAPYLGAPTYNFPVTFEFERPTKPVVSAQLHFFITEHWSGTNGTTLFDVVDAPINVEKVSLGVASKYELDTNLKSDPGIIGNHRYADNTPVSDYFEMGKAVNYEDRRNYSPHLWGGGPPDTTKYPYKALGKWVGSTSENFTMVNSSYSKEGFKPLVPGLGALRVHMPADTEIGKTTPIVDGSNVGYSGTKAADAKIYMPEDKYGLLSEIYTRYYVRIGDDPYNPTRADQKQVSTEGPLKWTDMSGKFLINAAHKTKYGGNSGVAGGGRGWSLRNEFSDAGTIADESGLSPTTGGYGVSFSWYDYFYNNFSSSTNPYGQPIGYNYTNFKKSDKGPGQKGGLGSSLYKNKWYLVEIRMKLNSVDKKNDQDGRYWTPDGEVQMWVDGRLAYEKKGVVFRSLPIIPPDPREYPMPIMPPVRELGVAELWYNWYHGGVTRNTIPRTVFITGLAWGTQYIGPMNFGAAKPNLD